MAPLNYKPPDISFALTSTEMSQNLALECARFCGILHGYPIKILYIWIREDMRKHIAFKKHNFSISQLRLVPP